MEVTGALARLLSDPFLFIVLCLALDAVIGDPPYRWHPIRIMGALLAAAENLLRRIGWEGRFGGVALFLILAGVLGGGAAAVFYLLDGLGRPWGFLWELYLGYSLLALGDLVAHGRRIARAAARGDLPAARAAAGMLVGRDTDHMDSSACNRAAVESLAESLVDGILSPLFWFILFGLPGLLVFKIASTMDSMVGYKNERYLRFGWFGARLDDVMNYLPARLSVVFIVLFAWLCPGFSARKAWRTALGQHALVPGPNAGWSETAAAGALGLRLAGPIRKGGLLVNELWIGRPEDPEGASPRDVARMTGMVYGVTALFLGAAWLALYRQGWAPWRP